MNTLRLLVGLIDRPGEAFEQIREAPRRLFLVPVVIMALSFVAFGWISAPHSAKLAGELIRQRIAQLPPQQAEIAAQAAVTPGATQMAVTTIVGGTLLAILGWVIWGAILHFWGGGWGANSRPGQMILAVGWASLPHAFRNLVMAGFVLFSGELVRNQGLSWLVATGNLLKDSQSPLYVFLSGLDLFWLWGLFLLTVAVSAVAGFSRRQSLVVVLVTWFGGALLALLPTVVSSFFLNRALGG